MYISTGPKVSEMSTSNLVLRTVYISPDVDDELRQQAFAKRTSKNDLIRRYLELGMKAAQEAGAVGSPAKVKLQKAAPVKKAAANKGASQASHGTAKSKAMTKSSGGATKVVAVGA